MDEEGYIVAHGDMMVSPRQKFEIPNIVNMHITRKVNVWTCVLVNMHITRKVNVWPCVFVNMHITRKVNVWPCVFV